MKSNGYIKLHRSVLETPYSNNPDYAWLWCTVLLLANHKENSFVWNGKTMTLKPGQLITGRKELSKLTGIMESKIYRILNYLEKEQQIEQQKTNKFTVITVLNWGKYQKSEQQSEQPVNNKWTTNEQQVNTNNNDKKEKNDKNKTFKSQRGRRKYYPEDSIEIKLSKHLFAKIKENNPKHRPPNWQLWASHIDRLMKIDKRTSKEIREVIDWCQADNFWFKNILSTEKLRKQFDTLCIRMTDKNKNNKGEEHGPRIKTV